MIMVMIFAFNKSTIGFKLIKQQNIRLTFFSFISLNLHFTEKFRVLVNFDLIRILKTKTDISVHMCMHMSVISP